MHCCTTSRRWGTRSALRWITRPGGRVIVALNGEDHLGELRDVVVAALAASAGTRVVLCERISLDQGEALLRSAF